MVTLVSHFTPLLWCYPRRTLHYRTYYLSNFGPPSWYARTIHCQVSFLPSHLCCLLLSLHCWWFAVGPRPAAAKPLWAKCPLWPFLALKVGSRSSSLYCLDFVYWTHQRTCVCSGQAIVSRMSLSLPWRQRQQVGDLTRSALPSDRTLKPSFLEPAPALCDTRKVHDGTKQAPCSYHKMKSRLGICRSVGRLSGPLDSASRDCLAYRIRKIRLCGGGRQSNWTLIFAR